VDNPTAPTPVDPGERAGGRKPLNGVSPCSPRGTPPPISSSSPDRVESHQRFRDKYDLNFRLLADPDHEVAEAFGAWGLKRMYGREYEGILRSTFVIDADGTIVRVYAKVKPADHAERILADLE
jgi:peroxiredoxin